MKLCKKCGQIKNINKFGIDKQKKDGKNTYCKECINKKSKEKYIPHPLDQSKKTCTNCKTTYPKTNEYFFWQVEHKGYLQSKCKQCAVKVNFEYYQNSINGRLASIYRSRFRLALNKKRQVKNKLKYLGCSIDEWKKYLENKFEPWMNWDNYGTTGWHIDHIKPCCSFDLTKESERKKCFHYTNTQPLGCKENLSKGSKLYDI